MRRVSAKWIVAATFLPFLGCESRSFEIPPPNTEQQIEKYYPQSIEKDVDLLFVIDNSGSMEAEQRNLAAQFPKLIEALRSDKLGGAIPNVHIGVVSTDLGAGPFDLPSCEAIRGDGGQLQTTRRVAGCEPPRDPWISYIDGQTNIPGCNAATPSDAVNCVKTAFSCIAELGIEGCGFEMQLESARLALDPGANVNPNFLRPDAFLAIVFITDEDDCSARDVQLFSPALQGLTDPLGPLTSFRCFEFGIQCDINDRTKNGPRNGCIPTKTHDYLYKVEDYIKFFEKLKPAGRLIMAAIAGPTGPVSVGQENNNPNLNPSCSSNNGFAVPAIRLEKVVSAFNGQITSVCDEDFGPAMTALGKKIVASLGGQCIDTPLLLPNGGVACHEGVGPCKIPQCPQGETCDPTEGVCVAAGGQKTEQRCGATCLDGVDCAITEVTGFGTSGEVRTQIAKCPRKYFLDPSIPKGGCEGDCPCWRIVPRTKDCTADLKVSPFGLEVMRQGDAPKGTVAVARCRSATFPWSDAKVQQAAAHCTAPAVGQ